MRKTLCTLIAALMTVAVFLPLKTYADKLETEKTGEEDTEFEICDINHDGEVNNKDVVLLFKLTSGSAGSGADADLADFDMDGEINNKDVVSLFRYLSGYEIYPAVYKGEPAYEIRGDKIVVDGIEYPNNKNMTNGIMYAVDDLGREVTLDAKPYVSDGSKNVGIFYFLWLGEHGDYGVFDITKILAAGGDAAKDCSYEGWGPVGAMHFWGEPLYGYYYSEDKWVLRRHVDELMLAGVDFVFIDATNGYPYISNAKKLIKIMHAYNEQGFDAPQIVFYTHTKCASTVKKIYNGIYNAETTYPDTWFMLDGKPLIIAYESECRSELGDDICNTFTFREPQWPTEAPKANGWPWIDFSFPQRVYKNKSGVSEVINVSVAQHNSTICFSDSAIYNRGKKNRGRSFHDGKKDTSDNAVMYGYNFRDEWDRALDTTAPYVLVTGWNEWVAQRQDASSTGRNATEAVFIDTANIEYSRDIEPMRGGYFDNYYMQLTDNIRRYKGAAPALIHRSKKVIDIEGGFDQWDDVLVTYTDPSGDRGDRESPCFGNSTYTDKSGRNDIVNSKIIYDSHNIYFYADTKNDIVLPESGDSTFMQLFLNTDMDAKTGFYGFDYIVNYSVRDEKTTTLAKAASDGTKFDFEQTAELSYRIEGGRIMIKVPMEALGIKDPQHIKFAFKWADSKTAITTMEQMYTDGDCAPHGRLSYVFQTSK